MLLGARLLLLAAVAAWHLVAAYGDRGALFGWSLVVHLTATAAFLFLVRAVLRGDYRPSFFEAIVIALLLRAVLLPLAPQLSDDVWRYLHEGNLVAQGENPYVLAPADTPVEYRHPEHFEKINHMDVPAAYPPLVQYHLALVSVIHPEPLGIKVLFGSYDLLTFVLLWLLLKKLRLNPARAIVHGFCPLLALEFAGEGHSDSMVAFWLVLSVYVASCGKNLWSGGLLALATASKLLPAVFLPFVSRGHRWALLPFAVVLLGLYVPFLAVGMFEATIAYGERWSGNGSMFALLTLGAKELLDWVHATWDTKLWNLIYYPHNVAKGVIGGVGLLLMWMAWRRRWPLHQVVAMFLTFFVVCTPTLHPWYLGIWIPWLCIYPNLWFLGFTGTVFLAYHTLPAVRAGGAWQETWWVTVIEYVPLYVGLFTIRRARAVG